MRIHHASCLLAFAFLGLAAAPLACSDDDDDGAATSQRDAGNATLDATAEAAPPVEDGGIQRDTQILHVMATANTGEVEQGTIAQTRATDAEVVDFANMMVTEHTAAKERGNALAQSKSLTPEDNPISQQLVSDSASVVAMLQAASAGAVFDKAYIDSQVTVHTKVLAIIDQQLLPKASDADLRAELTTMRSSVAMHLSHAQMVQQALAADAGADAGGDGGGGEGGI